MEVVRRVEVVAVGVPPREPRATNGPRVVHGVGVPLRVKAVVFRELNQEMRNVTDKEHRKPQHQGFRSALQQAKGHHTGHHEQVEAVLFLDGLLQQAATKAGLQHVAQDGEPAPQGCPQHRDQEAHGTNEAAVVVGKELLVVLTAAEPVVVEVPLLVVAVRDKHWEPQQRTGEAVGGVRREGMIVQALMLQLDEMRTHEPHQEHTQGLACKSWQQREPSAKRKDCSTDEQLATEDIRPGTSSSRA